MTEQGFRQAHAQAGLIEGVSGHAVSSPLGRAEQTAKIVFAGRPYRLDERLAEIDIGSFSGQRQADLSAAHPELFTGGALDWYDRAPDGEGFDALAQRVQSFLDDLTGPALVVTHGITMRMMVVLALGWDRSRLSDVPQTQGVVHVIRNGTHEIWGQEP